MNREVHGKLVGDKLVRYERINKAKAKRLFNAGAAILVTMVNMDYRSVWESPVEIDNKNKFFESFDSFLNTYLYHHSCPEYGRYAKFYVKISEESI